MGNRDKEAVQSALKTVFWTLTKTLGELEDQNKREIGTGNFVQEETTRRNHERALTDTFKH